MTQGKSSSEAHEDVADAVGLEQGIGEPAGPADPAGIASLGLNAHSTDPAITEALSGFLHEQRELARRQCGVADKQSALLERRIERAGLEQEHIEAQNRHLHMQHFHDRDRKSTRLNSSHLGISY